MDTYKESKLYSLEISGVRCIRSTVTVCFSVNSFGLCPCFLVHIFFILRVNKHFKLFWSPCFIQSFKFQDHLAIVLPRHGNKVITS